MIEQKQAVLKEAEKGVEAPKSAELFANVGAEAQLATIEKIKEIVEEPNTGFGLEGGLTFGRVAGAPPLGENLFDSLRECLIGLYIDSLREIQAVYIQTITKLKGEIFPAEQIFCTAEEITALKGHAVRVYKTKIGHCVNFGLMNKNDLELVTAGRSWAELDAGALLKEKLSFRDIARLLLETTLNSQTVPSSNDLSTAKPQPAKKEKKKKGLTCKKQELAVAKQNSFEVSNLLTHKLKLFSPESDYSVHYGRRNNEAFAYLTKNRQDFYWVTLFLAKKLSEEARTRGLMLDVFANKLLKESSETLDKTKRRAAVENKYQSAYKDFKRQQNKQTCAVTLVVNIKDLCRYISGGSDQRNFRERARKILENVSKVNLKILTPDIKITEETELEVYPLFQVIGEIDPIGDIIKFSGLTPEEYRGLSDDNKDFLRLKYYRRPGTKEKARVLLSPDFTILTEGYKHIPDLLERCRPFLLPTQKLPREFIWEFCVMYLADKINRYRIKQKRQNFALAEKGKKRSCPEYFNIKISLDDLLKATKLTPAYKKDKTRTLKEIVRNLELLQRASLLVYHGTADHKNITEFNFTVSTDWDCSQLLNKSDKTGENKPSPKIN